MDVDNDFYMMKFDLEVDMYDESNGRRFLDDFLSLPCCFWLDPIVYSSISEGCENPSLDPVFEFEL